MRYPVSVILTLIWVAAPARAQSLDDVRFPTYETKYYTIHTDLTGDALREADLRMTRMAEEYRARTREFFGSADRRLPFYLFRKEADYYATGVPLESAGVFTGSALLALAGEKTDLGTWHTIQHEGFHQFVHAAIGGNLPIWLNEGLAEYFGEALFTGDGYEAGLIPQWRLERIRETLKAGDFVPLKDMLHLPASEWNAKLSVNNYDQAWSMVQFLAHGDNGRYQRAFGRFIGDTGRGSEWTDAWQQSFGGDVDGFQRRWSDYWSNLPNNPTANGYARVATRILTNFLARASAQRQRFETFADFSARLAEGKVPVTEADWLPPSLGRDGAGLARRVGNWSIDYGPKGQSPPRLMLEMKDGTRMTGTFTLGRDGKVTQVRTDVQPPRLRPLTSTRTTGAR